MRELNKISGIAHCIFGQCSPAKHKWKDTCSGTKPGYWRVATGENTSCGASQKVWDSPGSRSWAWADGFRPGSEKRGFAMGWVCWEAGQCSVCWALQWLRSTLSLGQFRHSHGAAVMFVTLFVSNRRTPRPDWGRVCFSLFQSVGKSHDFTFLNKLLFNKIVHLCFLADHWGNVLSRAQASVVFELFMTSEYDFYNPKAQSRLLKTSFEPLPLSFWSHPLVRWLHRVPRSPWP